MKQKILLVFSIILALCLVQGAAAAGANFVQSEATVEPASGDLAPGDQVIVHVIVKLTGGTDTTFNTNDELEAYTELVDPKWDYTILVNDQGIPKHSTSLYVRLLGWDLAYPDGNDVVVDYALVGKVPTVPHTSDVTLFRLRQKDTKGNVQSSGELLIKPTVIVNPEMQFVTATTSSATIAKGDDLYISGNAKGNATENVAVWIFGGNCVSYATETVEENGAFEHTITNTANLAAGQYFVVVQHPMNNNQFDLVPQAGNPAPGQAAVVRPILDSQFADPNTGNFPPVFILEGRGKLQGCDAANALVDAINNPDIDDTYYELSFMVEEPWIVIDAIGDRYVSKDFTITGTTNLAVGDTLVVQVAPLSSGFASSSGTVFVNAGERAGVNIWEFAVDPALFTPDEYIVTVECAEVGQTATQTFTIMETDPTNYVTITTSGNSSYYIGEDIIFSGKNIDSNNTWLFITGPNLRSKGAPTFDPRDGVVTGGTTDNLPVAGSWAPVIVEADDTWEYTWETTGVNLDQGTYTIYAVSSATNKDDLETQHAIYTTKSIEIKKPFITATSSSATIARGDDLYITGNAKGDPTPGVAIWILGKNYVNRQTETIEDDGSFEFKFTGTDSLAAGQYFVVVQHPMENDRFDLVVTPIGGTNVVQKLTGPAAVATSLFVLDGPGSLQGSEAATALVNAMNSPDIDDTHCKLTFMVEEPWITIDAIGDKYTGETFTISGTTNLAADNNLTVEVTPLNSAVPSSSGTACVTAGNKDGVNTWAFIIDTSSYAPDKYIVTIECGPSVTQTFNVLQADQNQDITINAIQNSPHYLGEDILISGTNNKSESTWLFVSGPDLPETGGSFMNPYTGVNSATNANGLPVSPFYPDGYLDSGEAWKGVTVGADNTWECSWKTAGADLDAGIYTIYAVTTATDKGDLARHSARYAIASVTLREPYVTATTSSATVARGDDLFITGNAKNNPTPGIGIWVFSKNYVSQTSETVEENGGFDYALTNTTNFAAGQYFVVVQHPMENDRFDLVVTPIGGTNYVQNLTGTGAGVATNLFALDGPGSLQGSEAATALVNAMNNPDIDDTCFRLTFMVEEPWIQINPIGDKVVRKNFTISGTTNLAIEDSLNVNITKTHNSSASSSSGTVSIAAGDTDGVNIWEFAVDTSTYTYDQYIVTVESSKAILTATQTFNVLQTEPTPQPTPTPVPTPQPTHDVTISLSPGWNLIATPVKSPTINASAFLFEDAFAYNTTTKAYETVPLAEMDPGEGYWVGAFEPAWITFTGVPLAEYQKELSNGWNLIGGLGIATETASIHVSPDALSGPLYSYNQDAYAYNQATILKPGQGYWVSTAAPCTMNVNITPPTAPQQ